MNPVVPKTKGGVGSSFKGTARYLLHDKGASSDERVLWTETLNMPVEDPQLAWKIMTATALDSDRLKRAHHDRMQTGRPLAERRPYKSSKKSFNHVFHYALTWSPEEGPDLSPAVMLQHARGSLRTLGASDLQALVVCHQDTDHPHIHVMVNRVHPETGQVVGVESNAHRKLSGYALNLDRERGFTFAPQRDINARKRAAEIPYRADKRVPRKVFEQERTAHGAFSLAPKWAKDLRLQQAGLDRHAAQKGQVLKSKLHAEAKRLFFAHKQRQALIQREADDAKKRSCAILADHYSARFEKMLERMRSERMMLSKKEDDRLARLIASLKAVRTSWAIGREKPIGQRLQDTFDGFGSSGYADVVLGKVHAQEEQALLASYRAEITDQQRNIDAACRTALHENTKRYKEEYDRFLKLKTSMKRDAHTLWQNRDMDRQEAWRGFDQSVKLERDFENAAAPADRRQSKADEQRSTKGQTLEDKRQAILKKLRDGGERER